MPKSNSNVPTPEEFKKLFCPADLNAMNRKDQSLKHGEIFNMLENNWTKIENFDGDNIKHIGFKIEENFESIWEELKMHPVEQTNAHSNLVEINVNSSNQKLILKRKADIDMSDPPLSKRFKVDEIDSPLNYNYARISIDDINEEVYPLQITDVVNLSTNITEEKYLYKPIKNQIILSTQVINKINLQNIYNVQPNSLHLQSTSSKLNDVYSLAKKKPIWDTTYLIRKLQSFHRQITKNFISLPDKSGYLIMKYAANLLSSFLFIGNKITKHAFTMAHEKFLKIYCTDVGSKTLITILESFGNSLVQLINRNVKMTKFNLTRLICFILYCLYKNINFPTNTSSKIKWSTILDAFCIFEANFLKMYRSVELDKLKNDAPVKINNVLFIKPIELQSIIDQLFQNSTMCDSHFNESIYECLCGRIVISLNDWYKHISVQNDKANLEMENSVNSKHCQYNDVYWVTHRSILSEDSMETIFKK